MGALAGRRWLTDEPAYANLLVKHRTGALIRNLVGGLFLGLICGPPIALAIGLAERILAQGLPTGLAGVVPAMSYLSNLFDVGSVSWSGWRIDCWTTQVGGDAK